MLFKIAGFLFGWGFTIMMVGGFVFLAALTQWVVKSVAE